MSAKQSSVTATVKRNVANNIDPNISVFERDVEDIKDDIKDVKAELKIINKTLSDMNLNIIENYVKKNDISWFREKHDLCHRENLDFTRAKVGLFESIMRIVPFVVTAAIAIMALFK